VKFQTLVPGKPHTRVCVNGRIYPIDAFGCIEVEHPEDQAKLRRVPTWSETVRQVSAQAPAGVAAPTVKDAAALKMDLENNEQLFAKVATFRSPLSRRAWLEGQGYRFTDQELEAILAPPPKKVEPAPAPALEPVQKAPTLMETLSPAPGWTVPVGDEEWPDPLPAMPRPYLQAMARAYGVTVTKKLTVEQIVARVHAAMYPDDQAPVTRE
jgi:hypothetical protein